MTPQGRFAGRVALVTGGGRGIGKATATELALGGASLVVNDLDPERLGTAAAELRDLGARVTAVAGDVSDEAFVTEMVRTAERDEGRVDILINNVGGGPAGVAWTDFRSTAIDDFRRFIDVNLMSQVMCAHAVVGGMVERGYGKIVCVSSISAVLGQENGIPYATGKAAIHGFVKSLAKEVARFGVNVNVVVLGNPPHPTRTERRQEYLDELSHFGRVGRFEEFGKAIAFLASDDASYISGAVLPIDGGISVPRMNE